MLSTTKTKIMWRNKLTYQKKKLQIVMLSIIFKLTNTPLLYKLQLYYIFYKANLSITNKLKRKMNMI